jgi:hypothetical protein
MTDNHHLRARWIDGPITHERTNAQQVLTAEKQALEQHQPIHVSKLPGDPQALRGIPAIGRGVTGAINGTRPTDITA